MDMGPRSEIRDMRADAKGCERRVLESFLAFLFYIQVQPPLRKECMQGKTPRKSVCLRSLSYHLPIMPWGLLLLVLYASKVKEVPTLWVAWSSFWVSNEAPRPRVTPGRRRTL
jgi:hypothetical protein